MTPAQASDPAAIRKRHLKFVAALLGVTAFCWLSLPRERPPELPSIEVCSIDYARSPWWRSTNRIHVTYAVTNSGRAAFSFNPRFADYIRFETSNGWETNDLILENTERFSSWWPLRNSYQFFPPGAAAKGNASLPATALRWQVGYEVRVASPRSDLERKFGPTLTKHAVALMGNSVSTNEGFSIIWGPIIEFAALDKARIKSLQQIP